MTKDLNAPFTAGEYRDLSRAADAIELTIEDFFELINNRPAARAWLGGLEARAQLAYDESRGH